MTNTTTEQERIDAKAIAAFKHKTHDLYRSPINLKYADEEHKIKMTIDAYETFLRLKITAAALANEAAGSGYCFQGITKKRFAKLYVANEYNMQAWLPFAQLVEWYGCRA